tara:strand:- start:66 stop:290 length:225 start_codon:yes stop_codon:yes gene_type:complete
MIKKNKSNTLNFESAMAELEDLISKINTNDVSLDKMVEVFERASFLTNYCNKELTKVEKKINLLSKGNKGIKVE